MTAALASLLALAACGGPACPTPTARPPTPAKPAPVPLGRAGVAPLACPAGTAPVSPEPHPCSGRVYDWPVPRLCNALEYSACSTSFGTSAGGAVTVCRRADGLQQGPIEVREADGSVTAQGTCRDGLLEGPLYRWRAGTLAEIVPMRGGAPDGLYLRWDARGVVAELRYSDGRLASPGGAP
jgi:hypothetical protein